VESLVIVGPVECHGGPWLLEYSGLRTADIYFNGHAVDCVQVRDWDFAYGPTDQPAPVPSRRVLESKLVSFVSERGADYA